jgi:hypothetical protein
MRMTPAQLGMHQLLGGWVPVVPEQGLIDRIRSGRAFLVNITKQDFGFDPLKWHEYLWMTDAGGYKWCRRSPAKWEKHARMQISRPEWIAAVQQIESEL